MNILDPLCVCNGPLGGGKTIRRNDYAKMSAMINNLEYIVFYNLAPTDWEENTLN